MNKLRSLNFEGCQNLTDNAFKFLLLSNENKPNSECVTNPKLKCRSSFDQINEIESDDNGSCENCLRSEETHNKPHLVSVNLSGCWSISDYGLR